MMEEDNQTEWLLTRPWDAVMSSRGEVEEDEEEYIL